MIYITFHAHASVNIIEKNDFYSSVIQLVEQPSSRDRKVQSWYRRPNRTGAPENQVKGESIIHRFHGLEKSPSFSGRNTVLSSAWTRQRSSSTVTHIYIYIFLYIYSHTHVRTYARDHNSSLCYLHNESNPGLEDRECASSPNHLSIKIMVPIVHTPPWAELCTTTITWNLNLYHFRSIECVRISQFYVSNSYNEIWDWLISISHYRNGTAHV